MNMMTAYTFGPSREWYESDFDADAPDPEPEPVAAETLVVTAVEVWWTATDDDDPEMYA